MTSVENLHERAIDSDAVPMLARRYVYRFLSLALSDPLAQRWSGILDRRFQDLAVTGAQLLRDGMTDAATSALAHGELPKEHLDLASIVAFLRSGRNEVAEEYQRVFGLMMSKKCPPYESEYCPQTFSVYRSQQIADIAGFYRAFGLEPSRDMPERADHVATELEFMAWLIAKEQWSHGSSDPRVRESAAVCREAQRRFFTDHLAWWTPAFARALRRRAEAVDQTADDPGRRNSPPSTYLGAAGRALASFVGIERAFLRIPPPLELVRPIPDQEAEPSACDECPIGSLSSAV
jgi:TorA maturation chaperone TorD